MNDMIFSSIFIHEIVAVQSNDKAFFKVLLKIVIQILISYVSSNHILTQRARRRNIPRVWKFQQTMNMSPINGIGNVSFFKRIISKLCSAHGNGKHNIWRDF